MKKYPYIVAAACVLVGAVGFSSIYATSQSQENQLSQNQEIKEENQVAEEEYNEIVFNDTEEDESQLEVDLDKDTSSDEAVEDAEVGTITEETLYFDKNGDFMWPIEGTVLLDYSMDSTIYFPTLEQYKCNPAMVFAADVNSKVYFVARGKITNIETNEETGCTVTQDLGDGYTAIYGQLKELNFAVGDMVEAGQVVGYVSEPTKYYSVEGSNVYFQLLKDGVPVDPEEILP